MLVEAGSLLAGPWLGLPPGGLLTCLSCSCVDLQELCCPGQPAGADHWQ